MSSHPRRSFLKRAAAGIGAAWGASSASWCRPLLAAENAFRARLAVCNEMFGDWPFEKAFALAAECGYQGIEIAPFTISDDVTEISAERRRQVRRQAEKAGLEIVGLHWLLARTKGLHLTSPEPGVRRRTAGYLGALARFCADLGGKLLIFGSPKQRNLLPGVERDQAMQYAAEVLRESLAVLEETGVAIAMEPLSPKTTDFVNTAAEAVELVDRVGSPRCGLILDCLAMSHEAKPHAELIRQHRSRLMHVHANDPNSQGPGFGKLDFVPIFQALRDIHYQGWISVEVFDYSPGAERLARESIRYMQECLAGTGS